MEINVDGIAVIMIAASGNENQAVSGFPGSDPRAICIRGANRDDVRKSVGDTSIESWWGACYGPGVDVVAPGLEIPTADRLGVSGYTPADYNRRFNGKSSATPHVAALAGLIISFYLALKRGESSRGRVIRSAGAPTPIWKRRASRTERGTMGWL
jgi:subtilisin family serine protease